MCIINHSFGNMGKRLVLGATNRRCSSWEMISAVQGRANKGFSDDNSSGRVIISRVSKNNSGKKLYYWG